MRRRGVGRAGRPGLVGTVARTAVIAGTATAVSKGVSGKMNAKEQAAAQADPQQETAQQQPATDAASGSGDSVDVVAELQKLASLKEAGVLTDDEFAAAKAKLLA
jgi:hypothetical protein